MDVEVPSAKAVTTIRRDLANVRQHTLLEIVDVERPWIFGLRPLRIIAACYDEHGLIARRRPNLMEVDALLKIVGLLHFIAEAAIYLDTMNHDDDREIDSD